MDARDIETAANYLMMHGYEEVKSFPDREQVAYRKGTGDGEWEKSAAFQNGWVRKEPGGCCRDSKWNNRNAKFCSNCGIGIGEMISWGKLKDMEKWLEGIIRKESYGLSKDKN